MSSYSTWLAQLNNNLLASYLAATKNQGADNEDDLGVSIQLSDDGNSILFIEEDGDIFYSEKTGTNTYSTSQIDSSDLTSIFNSATFSNYSSSLEELSDYSDYITDSTDSSTTTSSISDTYTHEDGTGSTTERVQALTENISVPDASKFKDDDGNISRDSIQSWLDKNGLSDSDAVDGGFNVDDVLTFYSIDTDEASLELYYHLLANEAWLDSDASGDNTVDGKLSAKEIQDFYSTRFGVDLTESTTVSMQAVKDWQKANEDVGNDYHDQFTYVALDNFADVYEQYTAKSSNTGVADYKYEDYTLSSSNFSTAAKISNVLDSLKSADDYEFEFTMSSSVKVTDVNTGDTVKLASGETYTITNVTSNYVTIDVDGEEVKVKRSTSSNSSFESLCAGAIKSATYSADSKITSSSSSSSSDDDYKYEDYTLSSSNFSTSTKISNVLNNLKSAGDYEFEFTMSSSVKVTDANTGDTVKLANGETYTITNVTSNYVTIDVDGEEVKVKRGSSSSSSFESLCAGAIKSATYSADTKITSSSSSSSSTNGTYSNYTMSSRSVSDIESIIDNLQSSSSYEASITISNKNWFDEDGNTVLSVGDYDITKITSSYVYLTDEDGNQYKISRGTDEYDFEWYCSKKNSASKTVLNAEYD